MIQTNSFRALSASTRHQPASSAQNLKDVSGGEDRFDLSEVPTGVKLYDMSPVWGPHFGPVRIPLGVHGLA